MMEVRPEIVRGGCEVAFPVVIRFGIHAPKGQ